MNKILTLALALMLAFTANSYADNSTSGETYSKEHKEKMHKNRENRVERAGKGEHNDKMKAKRKEARTQCAAKCGVNKEKVKQCRKSKGFNKENKGDGSCVGDKKKKCVKSCMKSKKSAMKEKHRKENGKHKKQVKEDLE